jgi:hypothetical protein
LILSSFLKLLLIVTWNLIDDNFTTFQFLMELTYLFWQKFLSFIIFSFFPLFKNNVLIQHICWTSFFASPQSLCYRSSSLRTLAALFIKWVYWSHRTHVVKWDDGCYILKSTLYMHILHFKLLVVNLIKPVWETVTCSILSLLGTQNISLGQAHFFFCIVL